MTSRQINKENKIQVDKSTNFIKDLTVMMALFMVSYNLKIQRLLCETGTE